MSRFSTRRWRNRIASLIAAGGMTAILPGSPIFAQVAGSASSTQTAAPTPAMRMQAISVLAAQNWQNDRDMEDLLLRTLRGDNDEAVRKHVANVMLGARSLTPRAFATCHAIATRNFLDGYPVENSEAVQSVAGEAVRKHGRATSASPQVRLGSPSPTIPAGVPANPSAKIAFMPAGSGQAAASKNVLRADLAEESQFNEKNAITYPALRISQPPAPCACDGKIVAEPAPTPSFGSKLFGRFAKREAPAEVVVEAPTQATTIRPTPTPVAAASIPVTQTAGQAPISSPAPTPVQPASLATSPLTVPIQNGPLPSLAEMRVELRKEGMKNLGIADFAKKVGDTPPPVSPTAAAPSEAGPLRRWFSPGAEKTPEITPVSATAPSEGGFLRRWFGSNRDAVVETPQPFQPQGPPAWLPIQSK